MPIYEYKCAKCGVFEVTGRITEPSLRRCPTCKGKVDRIISHTSFVLKGSGWYASDYAKGKSSTGSESNQSATNGSTEKTGSTDSSTKSESSAKPEKTSSTTEKPASKSSD